MKDVYNICKMFFTGQDMRFTKQRRILLDCILSMDKHFAAECLYAEMMDGNEDVSKATIYRSLPVFERAGIIKQVMQDNKITYYELAYKKKHHDHLICANCGKIIEFNSKKLEDIQYEIYNKHNFVPTAHQLILKGICSNCRRRQNGTEINGIKE